MHYYSIATLAQALDDGRRRRSRCVHFEKNKHKNREKNLSYLGVVDARSLRGYGGLAKQAFYDRPRRIVS